MPPAPESTLEDWLTLIGGAAVIHRFHEFATGWVLTIERLAPHGWLTLVARVPSGMVSCFTAADQAEAEGYHQLAVERLNRPIDINACSLTEWALAVDRLLGDVSDVAAE